MAWIESHQTLRDHPKTKKLARLLGLNRKEAIGTLHYLWWWALDYADDGDLSRFSIEDIEDGIDWEGESGALVRALVAAGFIDEAMTIHDWDDFAGKLVREREYNRNRMRAARSANKRSTCTERASNVTDIPINSDGSSENVQRTSGARASATQPDPTGPNRTGPDQPSPSIPPASDDFESALPRRDDGDGPEKDEKASDSKTERPWAFSLAILTPDAREFLDSFRAAYGKRSPPKLNREQVRRVEEAIPDLGMERLNESATWAAANGVEYGGGGVIKAINGARTKRQRDEEGIQPERSSRNGRSHTARSGPEDDRLAVFDQFDGRARSPAGSDAGGAGLIAAHG